MNRTFQFAALGLMSLVLAVTHARADQGATAQTNNEQIVGIQNFAFTPAELEVPVGTRITWVNQDSTVHSVVSKDKGFASSPGLDTGDKYSYVFTSAGGLGPAAVCGRAQGIWGRDSAVGAGHPPPGVGDGPSDQET